MFIGPLYTTAQSNLTHNINDTLLINVFKQSKRYNNCSSIALIKAAMGTFGISALYKQSFTADSNSIVFTLRNREVVTVEKKEIHFSVMNNGFIAKHDRIKSIADTCFAIMCKKQQLKDSSNFEAAVGKLNSGYITLNIASLLGIGFKRINATSIKTLSKFKHIVVYNYYHAAYSSNGMYDESVSKTGMERLRNFKWNHLGKDYTYISELCDIKEGLEIIDL